MFNKSIIILCVANIFNYWAHADYTYKDYAEKAKVKKEKASKIGYVKWVKENRFWSYDDDHRDEVRKTIFNDILATAGVGKVDPAITEHRKNVRKEDEIKTYYSEPERNLLEVLSLLGQNDDLPYNYLKWIQEAKALQDKLVVNFNGKPATEEQKQNHWAIVYQAMRSSSLDGRMNQNYASFIQGEKEDYNAIEGKGPPDDASKKIYDYVSSAFKRINTEAVVYASRDELGYGAFVDRVKEGEKKLLGEKARQTFSQWVSIHNILTLTELQQWRIWGNRSYQQIIKENLGIDEFHKIVQGWFLKRENIHNDKTIVSDPDQVITALAGLYVKDPIKFETVLKDIDDIYEKLDLKGWNKEDAPKKQDIGSILRDFIELSDKDYGSILEFISHFLDKKYYEDKKFLEYSLKSTLSSIKKLKGDQIEKLQQYVEDFIAKFSNLPSYYEVEGIIASLSPLMSMNDLEQTIQDMKEVTVYEKSLSGFSAKLSALSKAKEKAEEDYANKLNEYKKKLPGLKEEFIVEQSDNKIQDVHRKVREWTKKFGNQKYIYTSLAHGKWEDLKPIDVNIPINDLIKSLNNIFSTNNDFKNLFEYSKKFNEKKQALINFLKRGESKLLASDLIRPIETKAIGLNVWDTLGNPDEKDYKTNIIGEQYKKDFLDYLKTLEKDLTNLFDELKQDFKKEGWLD